MVHPLWYNMYNLKTKSFLGWLMRKKDVKTIHTVGDLEKALAVCKRIADLENASFKSEEGNATGESVTSTEKDFEIKGTMLIRYVGKA